MLCCVAMVMVDETYSKVNPATSLPQESFDSTKRRLWSDHKVQLFILSASEQQSMVPEKLIDLTCMENQKQKIPKKKYKVR